MRSLAKSRSAESWDRLLFPFVALLFVERLISMWVFGPGSDFACDDVAYIQSGITFARNGVISVWTDYPTALIMPGISIVTGFFSSLFGEGTAYIASVKLLWYVAGSFTGYYIYKSMRLFFPAPWAFLAAGAMLLPNRVWIDNIISTETPYLLFFCANLYYTLNFKWDRSRGGVIKYALSFLLALCFRANILSLLPFSLLYLFLCREYSFKEIARRVLTVFLISLIFFVPWTIRNYLRFDAFIPISYGAGNPTLKGTYQGDSCPADDELDYEANVYGVIREKYARYYNADGLIEDPSYAQYVAAKTDGLMARYRMQEWFRRDPSGFLKAYLFDKPTSMLAWVYYWGPAEALISSITAVLSKINFLLCALAFVLAFIMKQKREIVLFLTLLYGVNLYILGFSFAVERYAALIMPMRWMLASAGLYLAVSGIVGAVKKRRLTQETT